AVAPPPPWVAVLPGGHNPHPPPLPRGAPRPAPLLAYLGAAARRTDAPPQAAEARAALAELVRTGPGTAPTAWRRIAERLTGLDPAWDPVSTVEALLAD
ncbi:hypothetical protein ACFW1I_27160, partial [Streptomyces sp. NPDC058955]